MMPCELIAMGLEPFQGSPQTPIGAAGIVTDPTPGGYFAVSQYMDVDWDLRPLIMLLVV
jgi:hypothetical protein